MNTLVLLGVLIACLAHDVASTNAHFWTHGGRHLGSVVQGGKVWLRPETTELVLGVSVPPPEVTLGGNLHAGRECYAVTPDCHCVVLVASIEGIDAQHISSFRYDAESATANLTLEAGRSYDAVVVDFDIVRTNKIVLPRGAQPYLRKLYKTKYARQHRVTLAAFLATDAIDIFCKTQKTYAFQDTQFSFPFSIGRLADEKKPSILDTGSRIGVLAALAGIIFSGSAVFYYVHVRPAKNASSRSFNKKKSK